MQQIQFCFFGKLNLISWHSAASIAAIVQRPLEVVNRGQGGVASVGYSFSAIGILATLRPVN